MKDPLDQFWNSVLAAEVPSVDEMARAEANLRALDPAPNLPQERIDAMVQAAVRATETGVPAPRRSRHTRRVVAAAAVLVLSMSLAFVGYKVLWREGTHALRTLDYAEAIAVAAEPNQTEDDKLQALFIIDENCGYALSKIRTLCQADVAAPLREQARQIRDQLLMLLTKASEDAPQAADVSLLSVTKVAVDESLPIEERQRALTHLGYLCVQGMRAFAFVELRLPESEKKRHIWRDRLVRELAQ